MLNSQFEKLKKINEYAKSLGMTIYVIEYGFIKDDKECIHKVVGLNDLSEKYRETLSNRNQYMKDCKI